MVRGTVSDVETNSGVMPQADGSSMAWTTMHAYVGGERIKFRVKQDGTMPVQAPGEGDEVEVAVSVNLKARPNDLLHPFVLELIAQNCTVLVTDAERSEARQERSLASTGGRKRTA